MSKLDEFVQAVAELPDDAPVDVRTIRLLLGVPDALPVERHPEPEVKHCLGCGWELDGEGACLICEGGRAA